MRTLLLLQGVVYRNSSLYLEHSLLSFLMTGSLSFRTQRTCYLLKGSTFQAATATAFLPH